MKQIISLVSGLFAFAIAILFASDAFAQAAAAVAPPTFLDSVLAWIAQPQPLMATALIVIEFGVRLIPSAKPLSILIPAQYVVKGISAMAAWLDAQVLSPLIANFNNVSLK